LGAELYGAILFEAEGDSLFGTASFPAFKRGIEDGRIDGDKISFNVRFQEALEGSPRNTYKSLYGCAFRRPDSFEDAGRQGQSTGGIRDENRSVTSMLKSLAFSKANYFIDSAQELAWLALMSKHNCEYKKQIR
jgi:hypothetical protein